MILLVVTVTLITFAFALVFAAILTREKIKGQNFFRIIFYIPNILSVVVISGIFSAIYKPENGMLNSIIGLFRNMSDPILWKGEKLVIPSIIVAMVWQAIGYYMVMYMASMSAVPISLYESANLDGAGRLTQFFQITIPLIWTNIRTTLDLLHHLHHQHGLPLRQGHDKRRAQRRIRCGTKLYVQPEGRRSLRLQHGHRRGNLPVLVCPVRLCQQGHQPRYAGILRREEDAEYHRKIFPLCGRSVQVFHLFCAGSAGRYHHRAGGMGVHGLHQAECRVLRQPVGTARRVLLAELCQRMERRENGRIYAQLGHRHALALALLLVVALPAAYCLSRFHFKGCKVMNTLFMAGLFINVNYIVVPIFLMLRDGDVWLKGHFGSGFLLNNLVVLAVVYAATALPFTIYLLSGYFATLPHDFEEAAYIDGASYFSTMTRIIFPMAKPSIITIILFNFCRRSRAPPSTARCMQVLCW